MTDRPLAETAEGRRLAGVVRGLLEELGGPRAPLRDEADLERDLGLGSLERVELLARVERAFGVRLPDDALVRATTPRKLLGFVLEALARPAAAPALPAAAAAGPPGAARAQAAPGPAPAIGRARTLVEILLARAESDPDRPHLTLPDFARGEEKTLTAGGLLAQAGAVGAALRERGLSPGARVAIMLPTGEDFFFAFFGALLAGAVPVPLYPPARLDRLEEYVEREARILRNAEPEAFIAFPEIRRVAALIRDRAPSIRHVATMDDLRAAAPSGPRAPGAALPRAEDLALIQYTSGSTGDPKGVALTHRNVLANIEAIGGGLAIRESDVGVSWLPLYHDMGLIGTWLTCLRFGIPLVVFSPLSFLARPERWLAEIHRHRATLSVAPNFGYDLCARKVPDEALEGLDLSCWRVALNGSEPVRPATIERFCARFGPVGFRREAMLPVYGLAESSVALLFPPLGRGPRIDRGRFVSCGTPLPGHEVRLVDEAGREIAEDGREGRLLFRGPSATAGYFQRPDATAQLIREDGWLDSGDLAYWHDGEIYICGRAKDVIVKAGRKYHPSDIEEAAERVEGVRGGAAAFAATDREGAESIVVAVEWRGADPGEEGRRALAATVSESVARAIGDPPDRVLLLPPGSIPRTSSGKVRRGAARDLYQAGALGRRPRAPWRQAAALLLRGAAGRAGRVLGRGGEAVYGVYAAAAILSAIGAGIAFFYFLALAGEARGRTVRRLAAAAARAALAAAGLWPRVFGRERLPRGRAVIVANHVSYLDTVVLAAVLPPDVRHIAKIELGARPVLGRFLRRAGHILVDRRHAARAVGAYAEARALLARGETVAIFPEATFTRAAGLRPFRLGAFQLAAEAGVPIVPVVLRGVRRALPAGTWLCRRVPIEVEIGEPIAPGAEEGIARIVALRDRAAQAIAARLDEPVLALVAAGPEE